MSPWGRAHSCVVCCLALASDVKRSAGSGTASPPFAAIFWQPQSILCDLSLARRNVFYTFDSPERKVGRETLITV
jgi:hypothetical protein